MALIPNKPSTRPPLYVGPVKLLDLIIIILACFSVVLVWALSFIPANLTITHPDSISALNPYLGITAYIILYAILALAAYRMSYGLYAGFHHTAVVGAFLTFGFPAVLIVAFIGRVVAELGRMVLHERLEIRPHNPYEAGMGLLFHASAHSLATLISGFVYLILRGNLPLTDLAIPLLWPIVIMCGINILIYQLLLVGRIYLSGLIIDRQKLTELIPVLLFGQVFSLPLALLMPVTYYSLPIAAFLMLIVGIVMAAFLFRVSERSRTALEQRIVELATLNSIGQSLTSSLELLELMRNIYQQVSRLMLADTFYIAMYSSDTQKVTFPLVMQSGRQVIWENRGDTNGLSEYVISKGKPLLLSSSVRKEAATLGITTVEEDGACFLGVPLGGGDEVIGMIGIVNHTRSNAFGDAERALLSTIGSQAAITIRNASLYNRVWEMADELALLNNVSSVVTATLDLDIVLDTTCAVIIQVGHADKTGIFLLSEDRTSIRLVHAIGLSDDYVAQFQNIRVDADSIAGQIVNQNAPLAITDVRTDPNGLGWRSLAETEGYVGLLTVPLVASENVIGFLAAYYSEPHLFGKSELDLMNTLANQVAVTVANARLYQDTQTRAQELSRLVEASRTFTSSLDPYNTAQTVLDELAIILKPDLLALLMVDDNNGSKTLRTLALRGIQSLDIPIIDGTIAAAIANRTALLVANGNEDLALLKRLALQSLYVLPMVSQDQVIGIVLVGREVLWRPTDRERQFAEALANQAATAIRNAQLYRQTDAALTDRVSELSSIEGISRQISGSLDLETIINDVLDVAIKMTGANLAGFALTTDNDLLNYVERYPASSSNQPINQILERDKGIIGRVLRTGETALVPDVRGDADYQPGVLQAMRSAVSVPVTHNHVRVGVIYLESERLDAFTLLHVRFLNNLADHTAIAIANARLFEERQIQIETLIKFRNLSLELLSLNSLNEVLNLIVEYALIIARAKDAHLYLYDRDTETLTFGASLWLDGRENVEATKPKRYGSTWRVANTGKSQYIPDVTQMERPPNFPNSVGFGAIARIPLKRGDQVIGVLNIAFKEPHPFAENEIRAFDLLANQAAIAIENARLFDEQRISRDRMQAILQSTRDGVILIDLNGRLILSNPAAERLLNYSLHLVTNEPLMRTLIRAHRHDPTMDSLMHVTRRILNDLTETPDDIIQENFQHHIADGSRDIEATVLPVRDNRGSNSGRLVVLRDISEEKAAERFREELTNMIVHDLRSPLSGVISSLKLIEDMILTNDLTGWEQVLGIAVTSSENQMRMIESMLEIDKLEQGHMPIHLEDKLLNPLVQKAIDALEITATASQIQLLDCVPTDLPLVRMDEEQIRRVLVNLIDNALRHTPLKGEVRVEAHLLDIDTGKGATGKTFVQIGVLDTGKGIPPEFRERVFDKFVQVPKSALRGQRGIGLGLTFCKLAVETHGGKIWVDSSPSGGAAFWFTLPIAESQESLAHDHITDPQHNLH